jgi:hypothetical protein
MVWAATTLVALAVALGLVLAGAHAAGKPVPWRAGLSHAAIATAGVVALAGVVFGAAQPAAVNAALLCLALSWIGGLFNLLFRLQGERAPGLMIALHAAFAVLGLVLLAV